MYSSGGGCCESGGGGFESWEVSHGHLEGTEWGEWGGWEGVEFGRVWRELVQCLILTRCTHSVENVMWQLNIEMLLKTEPICILSLSVLDLALI